ncbi:MAG: FIST N-terminal domain-containing protein [Pseudomonadota bacterium]
MEFFADATATPDTAAGIGALLARMADARTAPPSFAAIHLSAAHNAAAVRDAAKVAGIRVLHGGTSCLGVMAGGQMAADQNTGIGLFAIWDAEGRYGTGSAAKGTDARAAGRIATERALAQAGCEGEAPHLVWLTAVPGAEEAVIAGIEDVVGTTTPIIGGSAADNDLSGQWRSFDCADTYTDGVTVSVLFPSRPVSFAYQNGYAPEGAVGRVSRAEGRTVHEIDGRPAAEVYGAWTGGALPRADLAPVPILAESTFHPLGRPVAEVMDVPFYLLAHPATANPDGSLELFANIAEGESLHLMGGSPDSLTARAGRVARLAARQGALAPSEVGAALMVYCGGCMLSVREAMDRVASEVHEAVGGAPSLGIFTFGEQGPVIDGQNRHGNLMISCITFAR